MFFCIFNKLPIKKKLAPKLFGCIFVLEGAHPLNLLLLLLLLFGLELKNTFLKVCALEYGALYILWSYMSPC